MKKALSVTFACLILIASVFFVVSCGNNETEESASDVKISFTFEVVHLDGTTKTFEVKTYKAMVGDALVEKNYIAGENDMYGLYVKTVDGETLDWDKDGAYWAFYVNGEYASKGVDSTEIVDGATYAFKAEKAS